MSDEERWSGNDVDTVRKVLAIAVTRMARKLEVERWEGLSLRVSWMAFGSSKTRWLGDVEALESIYRQADMVVEKQQEEKVETDCQVKEIEPRGWLSGLRGYVPFMKDTLTVGGTTIKKWSLKGRWKGWTKRGQVELPDRKYFSIKPSSQGDRRPEENQSSKGRIQSA